MSIRAVATKTSSIRPIRMLRQCISSPLCNKDRPAQTRSKMDMVAELGFMPSACISIKYFRASVWFPFCEQPDIRAVHETTFGVNPELLIRSITALASLLRPHNEYPEQRPFHVTRSGLIPSSTMKFNSFSASSKKPLTLVMELEFGLKPTLCILRKMVRTISYEPWRE
ncbi:hypothetical protein G4B88_013883 [Cannabis sativa]|uniref:Uncharacterized protein n=1 Tax=Cannabis sativa TaxID=3483 RepID=A0A7J6I0G6_CANSA|nr:hypothetical protein G4B88_013883 [Cannabis sativa]